MTVITNPDVLTQDILDRCARRAPDYDRDNRFFHEDFEELRASGYLLMAVPVELGGLGLSLAEVCRETARLAYHAPATALATNMHVYWTGVAADLYRSGDRSLTWLLEEGGRGRGVRGGARRGRQRPAAAVVDHEGRASTAATASPATRSSGR